MIEEDIRRELGHYRLVVDACGKDEWWDELLRSCKQRCIDAGIDWQFIKEYD